MFTFKLWTMKSRTWGAKGIAIPKFMNQMMGTTCSFPNMKKTIYNEWVNFWDYEPFQKGDLSIVPIRVRSTKNMRLRSM